MRISRRTSHPSTASRAASRTRLAAAATLATAALAVSACSSSTSTPAPAATTQDTAGVNLNDIQILNSLQFTASELNTAFAVDSGWQSWTDADPAKLLISQMKACTKDLLDTKNKTLEPVTVYFKTNGPLPNDTPTPPVTTTGTSAGKSKGPATPSSAPSTSANTNDGNPAHWVASTTIVYKSSDAAKSAVRHMGSLDSTNANCGGPADTTPYVESGIGEVGPTWDNSQGVYVFVDTKTKVSVAAVAQRRGRYVVITLTRGGAKPLPTGYYDLESGPDTNKAADAATAVLAQLTDSVVNNG